MPATKRVLVTGADGFIGSHVTEHLVRQGHNVLAMAQYNSLGSHGWLDRCATDVHGEFEILAGDIRDPNGVRAAVQGKDAVLHLAALIAIPYSYYSPDSYVDTNVKGTLNVLQAVRACNTERLIHTSTSEVYGSACYVPIDEKHPLQAQSPYAATKIAADQLAQSFYLSFDTPVITIRPFNTYGPRQSTRAVIPSIITQIAGGSRQIKLGALHPSRDFTFVDDTATGFVSALTAQNCFGETINLGSNFEITIGHTVEMIAHEMNADIQIITDDIRMRPTKSEVERLLANTNKARQFLNWAPKHQGEDGFREGLRKTIRWFTNHDNLKNYRIGEYSV